MIDAVADRLLIPRGGRGRDLTVEQRDIHDIDGILASDDLLDMALARFERKSAAVAFEPKLIRHATQNLGAIWDYRGFTRPNGGRIRPLVYVEHIPVIRQMSGRADLDVLWRVLVTQGLMVHHGTDGEGNIAIYTDDDVLNYHAKGANSLSVGTEHMHLTTAENWPDKQLNAAAFLNYRSRFFGADIPLYRGRLGAGDRFVTVRRRGHVTHEAVSNAAGFHDRTDPGEKYEALMSEIRERALFYAEHHRF